MSWSTSTRTVGSNQWPGRFSRRPPTTIRAEEASYYLSTIDLARGVGPGLGRWRKTLFLATSRITADAAEYFGLPRERTVIIGSRIEV